MLPLGTVVGHATRDSARILAIFDISAGASARIAFRDTRGVVLSCDVVLTEAEPYKLCTFILSGLVGRKVRYSIQSYDAGVPPEAEALLASGSNEFRTLPDGPLRIGLVSCNDVDNHCFPKERRGAMWRRLSRLVAADEVDLIVHAGDQIYGDNPPPTWNPGDSRISAYRRHYVGTWTHPDVSRVLAACPSVMMWDDHEIYDGWGSNDADQSPEARTRFTAAAGAFEEFQAALNPSDRFADGFGWAMRHDAIAILGLDGRSQRNWHEHSVLGRSQLAELGRRLNALASAELKHLFVLVGTPVVYVPVLAADRLTAWISPGGVDDVRDAWTASNNREECRRLMMMLLDFAALSPTTQVCLLAGDVHVGTLAQIETRLDFGPNRTRPRLYQITSSGIGQPPPTGIEALMLRVLTGGGEQALLHQDITGSLRPIHGADHDYLVRQRNFAIVDPSNGAGDWDPNGNLWVRFHSEQAEDAVLEQLLPRVGSTVT